MARKSASTPARQTPEATLAAALGAVAGAAIVVDPALNVVVASEEANALLGFEIARGESLPALLCGESVERPVAEALAEGRPIQTVLPRPSPDGGDQMVRVRSLPLERGGVRVGAVLLLDRAGAADAEGPTELFGMWTADPAMKQMFRVVRRVAVTDAPVLVRGETGAGKELVAHALHTLSGRSAGPFRALNCAALPPSLLESELFGHVRGAFTGAVRDATGHFELAHGGTLFLDEIAELPLELQSKLLRVLETHSIIPVGGRDPVPVDVRIVSATHRSLRREVEAKRFRADLMYRLRVIPVFIPPLRARVGDLRLLAERFIAHENERNARKIEQVSPSAWRILESHDWPGNVRELQNVLTYAYATGEGRVLASSELPPELTDPGFSYDDRFASTNTPPAPSEASAEVSAEAQRILRALERTAGNRSRAAQILGMSRVTLWRRMKELHLAER